MKMGAPLRLSAQGEYSLNFNPCQCFGVRKFTLNQYLGSVNYKGQEFIWVHKSEERKSREICLALTSHGMQCDP